LFQKLAPITNISVHNISSKVLSDLQLRVLSLGLKFKPALASTPVLFRAALFSSIDELERTLLIAHFFDEKRELDPCIPPIVNKTKWQPTKEDWPAQKQYQRVLIENACNEIRLSLRMALAGIKHTIKPEDQLLLDILQELASDTSIVIKSADKNLGICIMDRATYTMMCMAHLNDTTTYKPASFNKEDLTLKLRQILQRYNMLVDDKGVQTELAKSLLQCTDKAKAALFYCLPKLHKWKKDTTDIPPGRPIASAIRTLTEATSKWVDKMLRRVLPYMERTVCSSTQQFILQLQRLNDKISRGEHEPLTDEEWCIFCADISSLYPSIPIDYGIDAVRKVCKDANVFDDRELDMVIDLLRFVLDNNYVQFNGNTYLQIKGTAMGTPVAVIYSIIVLFSMEDPITRDFLLYTRFIDDVCALCTKHQAETFQNIFQTLDPSGSIQFDVSSITQRREGVNLDVNLAITTSGHLKTCVYQKALNVYQYLPPFSKHRRHIFVNLVRNELRRYKLICSDEADYEKIKLAFWFRLLARGYTEDIFIEACTTVPSRDSLLIVAEQRDRLRVQGLLPKKKRNIGPLFMVRMPEITPKLDLKAIVTLPEQVVTERGYRKTFHSLPVTIVQQGGPSISQLLVRAELKPL
jgi:hypothetical protein